MGWYSVSIDLPSSHAEAFSEALMEAGALSAAIEDAWAGTEAEQPIFGEPGEPVEALWAQSRVIALIEETDNVEALLKAATATLALDTLPHWTLEKVEDQDWVRLTQSQFEPIQISDRLWITPTWHTPQAGAINLQLDPGLAFGTGSHPTTRLCLKWIDSHLQKETNVLDYGCGSGILAIAALKLGAKYAIGIDIDPQALVSSQANAEQNGVAHALAFYLPDTAPERTFDVVIANILTNPLRALAPLLAARCSSGGKIVLSGILDTQTDEIMQRYGEWFKMDTPVCEEGWACITGTRF